MKNWESTFEKKIQEAQGPHDPAHDLAHFRRVVKTAKHLAEEEGASLAVVVPAAWLHDWVNVPKNDPRRAQASRLSAEAACAFLREIGYPASHLDGIAHAIEAHSFSAAITPRTLEAKVVQDADRLDAIGAIGIARCFSIGVQFGADFYSLEDPLAEKGRPLNDRKYSLDHFEVKLFKLVGMLQTRAGREEGQRRTQYMRGFLEQIRSEIA